MALDHFTFRSIGPAYDADAIARCEVVSAVPSTIDGSEPEVLVRVQWSDGSVHLDLQPQHLVYDSYRAALAAVMGNIDERVAALKVARGVAWARWASDAAPGVREHAETDI